MSLKNAATSTGNLKSVQVGLYDLFIFILSMYSVIALAIEMTVPLPPEVKALIQDIDFLICLMFLADFSVRLYTAPSKLGYLKWGWIDLASSIPMIDAFRAGRMMRVIRILRLLRGVRSLRSVFKYALRKRTQSIFLSAGILSFAMLTFSSIAILCFENVPGANITTAGDALWWALTTMTTVGYGDRVPVTMEGRIIASMLMITGVGLFGTFTGLVASWFVDVNEKEELQQLREINLRLARIEACLPENDEQRRSCLGG